MLLFVCFVCLQEERTSKGESHLDTLAAAAELSRALTDAGDEEGAQEILSLSLIAAKGAQGKEEEEEDIEAVRAAILQRFASERQQRQRVRQREAMRQEQRKKEKEKGGKREEKALPMSALLPSIKRARSKYQVRRNIMHTMH